MAGLASSKDGAVFRFEVPCDLSQVHAATQAVHQFLSEQGCGEAEVMDCKIALVEACNNAIQNARPADRDLPVEIAAAVRAREIELRVTDHTPGFDWPAQAKLPAPEAERGRGIYLIQTVMDCTHYIRGGRDNVLVLRKKRV